MARNFFKVVGLIPVVSLTLTALALCYPAFLALLAFWPARRHYSITPQTRRFIFVIPAHNEELLIGRTLASLASLAYPTTLYRVCVVADNCSDGTARLAREGGATVYERHEANERGKGYALRWLLVRLEAEGLTDSETALVFLDADSTVEPDFLSAAASALDAGAEIVQAYYGGANPDESWRAALRCVALAAMNYARPMGRQRLGLSVGLKGNGMIFGPGVVQSLGWKAFSRAEDAEMSASLLLAGRRVAFAPQARVWGVMASTARQARTQEMRWESGRLELIRRWGPPLLRAWAADPLQRMALLDGAFELAFPPISVVAGMGGLGVAGGIGLADRRMTRLGSLILAELGVYIGASLVAAKVPGRVYRVLPLAPFFVLWKIGLYGRALRRGRHETEWQRTPRGVDRASS